jgi:hypothetical protein
MSGNGAVGHKMRAPTAAATIEARKIAILAAA